MDKRKIVRKKTVKRGTKRESTALDVVRNTSQSRGKGSRESPKRPASMMTHFEQS